MHNAPFLVKQKCQQHIFILDARALSSPPPPSVHFSAQCALCFYGFRKCTGGGGGSIRLEQTYKHPPKLEKNIFSKAYSLSYIGNVLRVEKDL